MPRPTDQCWQSSYLCRCTYTTLYLFARVQLVSDRAPSAQSDHPRFGLSRRRAQATRRLCGKLIRDGLSLVHTRSLRITMSAPKKYTWDDLKSAEAKTKEGILMLIHGKGQSSLCVQRA